MLCPNLNVALDGAAELLQKLYKSLCILYYESVAYVDDLHLEIDYDVMG